MQLCLRWLVSTACLHIWELLCGRSSLNVAEEDVSEGGGGHYKTWMRQHQSLFLRFKDRALKWRWEEKELCGSALGGPSSTTGRVSQWKALNRWIAWTECGIKKRIKCSLNELNAPLLYECRSNWLLNEIIRFRHWKVKLCDANSGFIAEVRRPPYSPTDDSSL